VRRGHPICLAVLLFLCGCDEAAQPSPSPTPIPSPQSATLRISNAGPSAVRNLTVLFPDSQTAYGDVAVGATTTYRTVARGVFRYAAYRLDLDGEMVTQPVIDWVGETPMEGRAFTYTIDVDLRRPRLQTIRLVSVTRDQ
jgi:hypothetical protein